MSKWTLAVTLTTSQGHMVLLPVILVDDMVCVCVCVHRKTTLLFFNRREEDILWRGELEQLSADNNRCCY